MTGAAERPDYMRPFTPSKALAYGGRYAVSSAYQEFTPMLRIVLPGNRLG